MMRVTARKNRPLLHREGEQRIDALAAQVRARFATGDKHQIYADKRDESRRYLIAAGTGEQTTAAEFPYLYAEAGETAPNLLALANLWLSLDSAWRATSAGIEKITVKAKKEIRQADGQKRIEKIIRDTTAALDAIGEKPPDRPKPKGPKKTS